MQRQRNPFLFISVLLGSLAYVGSSTERAQRRWLPVMHLRSRIGGVQAMLEGEAVFFGMTHGG